MKPYINAAIGTTSLIGIMLLGQANAGTIPYPNVGTENSNQYTFTASSTGQLNAYFAGSGAGYVETVTIFDSTTNTSITGLQDHTSHIGDMISLPVNAGDSIVFKNNVTTTGNVWSNIKANNTDGMNHVYSTPYAANQISGINVSGTYVAFEDLAKTNPPDYNYYDDTFVFTNVRSAVNAPEPAPIALFAAGFLGFGVSRRKANQA